MSWVSPKLKEGKSPVEGGRGVFARTNIKKGEVLTVYGGYVFDIKKFKNLSEYLKDFPYHVSDKLLFGPIRNQEIGIGEFYNHSCEPNAGFRDCITLVAINNIKRGEEITFDYAMCMTSNILNLRCQCGKKNCRKKIRGSDWKIPALQKRYKEYFIPFITEKIKKLK